MRRVAFLDLIGDFTAYVDHVLLNDLVSSDYGMSVSEFDDFRRAPLPAGRAAEYREYIDKVDRIHPCAQRTDRQVRHRLPRWRHPT